MLMPCRVGAALIARLPFFLLKRIAIMIGWLCTPLLRKRLKIARINIGLCFPALDAKQQAALLREHRNELLIGVFELIRAWFAPTKALKNLATIDGLEHLHDALSQNQGVLLFTGHFMAAELFARLIGQALPYRLTGVVRRNGNRCIEAELEAARCRYFAPTIDKFDMRSLVRTLRLGGIVMYSADQDFRMQHAFVPFFGVPAATLTTTPQIVAAGRARMLVLWGYRDRDDHYHIRISPAWSGWSADAPEQSAAIYMRELQTAIGQAPAQYLWSHRRFKTRPAGAAPLY